LRLLLQLLNRLVLLVVVLLALRLGLLLLCR
jgi:hypothetical protein